MRICSKNLEGVSCLTIIQKSELGFETRQSEVQRHEYNHDQIFYTLSQLTLLMND